MTNRFRNTRTGSVVNVSDATAARLGPEWEAAPVDAASTASDVVVRKPRRPRKKSN